MAKMTKLQIGDTCLAAKVRLVSRVVTSIYDEELRPLGVKASHLDLAALPKSLAVPLQA